MATAEDVLRVARSQLGYSASSTRSKFNAWYGMDGYWCAIYISWCAELAGAQDIIPRHSYTPTGAAWFKARGRWHRGAGGLRPGDVVYFSFGGKRIDHVGLFEGWRNGLAVTIDGNTGKTGGRSGGRVLRRARATRWVVGYGRPAYAAASASPAKTGAVAVDGFWGPATTRALQRLYRTPVDGVVSDQAHKPSACPSWRLGRGGSALVRAMQRKFSVSADGYFGPQTIRAAQRYYGTPVDGVISGGGRSSLIRAMQKRINQQLA